MTHNYKTELIMYSLDGLWIIKVPTAKLIKELDKLGCPSHYLNECYVRKFDLDNHTVELGYRMSIPSNIKEGE